MCNGTPFKVEKISPRAGIEPESVNSDLASHQQQGHKEMGPLFEVSSKRPEKQGINLAIPGLVV